MLAFKMTEEETKEPEEPVGTFDPSVDTDEKYKECEEKYIKIKNALENAFEKAG
ncbi:hypothetical protein LCGC14_0912100, partial [marine sediment metagenome]